MSSVSVIVPIYNTEKYILDTIKSLKKQTFKDCEFILVNDGSTDNSLKVIENAVQNDSRFIVINTKNHGVSSARNTGVKNSKGEYICFVDSDDILSDSALENLFNLAKNTSSDLVYGRMKRVNGELEWIVDAHKKHNLYTTGEKNIHSNPELFMSIGPAAKMYSRELIEKTLFPKEITFGEDQVVVFSAYVNAKKIMCGDFDVYSYRVRGTGDSLTQSTKKRGMLFLANLLEVAKKNREEIMSNKRWSYSEKQSILSNYYNRLITYEFYPIVKNNLKNHSKKSMMYTNDLLKIIPSDMISKIPAIRYFYLYDILNKFFVIPTIHMNKFQEMLKMIESKQTKKSMLIFNRKYPRASDQREQILINKSKNKFFLMKVKTLMISQKKKIYDLCFNLFKLLPTQKNKVVFVKSSNSKNNFLLLEKKLKENSEKVVIKFLTSPQLIWRNEIKKTYDLATAKIIVADDYYNKLYNVNLKRGTKYIQIWHGLGALKKFGHSALEKGDSMPIEFEKKAHRQYSTAICSSIETVPYFAEAFNMDKNKVLPLGSSKSDIFFSPFAHSVEKEKVLNLYPILKNKKIVLYAPTYRGGPNERKNFKHTIDWDRVIIPKDTIIVIKYHGCVEKVINRPNNKSVIEINNIDIESLMFASDLLITDFSSVIFDYALLKKPVIHHLSDIEEYDSERGFYFEIEEYIFGYKAYTDMEISELLDHNLELDSKRHKIFSDKFLTGCDGTSSDKISNVILNMIN